VSPREDQDHHLGSLGPVCSGQNGLRAKALIGSFVVVMLLALPASAAERTKRGAATTDRKCFNYPGSSYAHQGCRFTRLRDDSLRLKEVDARATVRYRFFVPKDATIDRIRIAWEQPSDTYACKDEKQRVVRAGRRIGIDAISGRRGHVSICVIDHVRVAWHL
jgi:hypothetical protein